MRSRIDEINEHLDAAVRAAESNYDAQITALVRMGEVQKLIAEEIKEGTSLETLSEKVNLDREVLQEIIEKTWL